MIHQIIKYVNVSMKKNVIHAQMKVLKWIYVLHAIMMEVFMKNMMIM